MPSLKQFRKMAGLPDDVRRWADAAKVVKEGQKALAANPSAGGWHPQVHQGFAKKDGLTPADFRWGQWPVSNVRLENSDSRHYAFYYRCNMPADTPVDNQYILEKGRQPGIEYEPAEGGWLKIPDPAGIVLSSVKFQLRDADTSELLDEGSTLLVDGFAQGKPSEGRGVMLWEALRPGASIKAQLTAFPLFYYLNESGGVMATYALLNNGYFGGAEVKSPVYTLSMDHDGNVTVA